MRSVWFGAASLVITVAAGQAQVVPNPAQSPPSRTGKAEIRGVVIDSLHGTYLAGAEVIVEGARVTLLTDSLGRFKVDALPPGRYQVGIFHPLLDTLGIGIATQPFHVGADSASFVTLAVPSASTIIARSCSARPRSQGNSAVIGQVIDAETLQPVPDVDVSVAWLEIEVSKEIGVRQSPRVVRGNTDKLGRFSVCGLPNSMQATLQAKRANSVTAEVPITLGESPTELYARTILLSAADSGAKTGTAVLTGRVTLEGTAAGSGTRVEVAGTDVVTTTNEKGDFTLRNLPSGTQLVVARHLGYAADAVAVDLSARQPKTVTMRLPRSVNIMAPVLVTARRVAALDRLGFTRRQKSGTGYYVGPEQLDRMKAQRLTDILRMVPGLRITYGPDGESVTSSRGTGSIMGRPCVEYYVDKMRWHSLTPGDINSFMTAEEIVAVEVYQGASVPAEFGMGGCTTVVLWTKMRVRD